MKLFSDKGYDPYPPPLDSIGDITIIHKSYQFFLRLYSATNLFPKKDRFSLGQKCQQLTLEILELLFTANAKFWQYKLPVFQEIDVKLKILKTLIRLCYDVKALDQKKYLLFQEQLQEIGKMLGGWIKATKNPAARAG